MSLLPLPKPQRITRSKAAVIEHIRETAPDKIDVITHVNTQNLNLVIAFLRKINAGSETLVLLVIPDSAA